MVACPCLSVLANRLAGKRVSNGNVTCSVSSGTLTQSMCTVAYSVVEFSTYGEMRRALDKLNNTELNGRRLRLTEDKSASKRRNK